MDSTAKLPEEVYAPEQDDVRLFFNPHPEPCPCRLERMTTETLRRMILLRRAEMPSDRLHLGGVPALSVLTAELLRRETADTAVQR